MRGKRSILRRETGKFKGLVFSQPDGACENSAAREPERSGDPSHAAHRGMAIRKIDRDKEKSDEAKRRPEKKPWDQKS